MSIYLTPTLKVRATVTHPSAQRFLDFMPGNSLVLTDELYIGTLNDHSGLLLTGSRQRGESRTGDDGRNLKEYRPG